MPRWSAPWGRVNPRTSPSTPSSSPRWFNNFYHQYHILHEENREKKVFLLWMTDFFRTQLERTLGILGIEAPPYM